MMLTGIWVSALSLLSLVEAKSLRKSLPNPKDVIDKALEALGGERAIKKLTGVTYHAPK